MADTKKENYVYARDATGHLLCEECGFKPKATERHPKGNPSTMHYHLKKHQGDFAHVCAVCQKGFLHKLTLDTHRAARHPTVQQETVELYMCPVVNCDFESLTKANRRIHFLRKHCHDQVVNYQEDLVVDSKKMIRCGCCRHETFKSGTAFHYHIGRCMLNNEIEVSPLLESVC